MELLFFSLEQRKNRFKAFLVNVYSFTILAQVDQSVT